MRFLLIFAWISLGFVTLVAAGAGWLYFSSSGLPDVKSLDAYIPASEGYVKDTDCAECASVPVLPRAELQSLFPALQAAEVRDGKTSFFAVQISRGASHWNDRHLYRLLNEMRFALQVRRRFSLEEQETIFLNRVYLGGDQPGVDSASMDIFGVTPSRLDTAQTALLMGLIQRPNYFSPRRHPDHALTRRNAVLEKMNLSPAQLAAEEAKPLELR
jgi:membrane carboxypeptidase/penicillin-binding protein